MTTRVSEPVSRGPHKPESGVQLPDPPLRRGRLGPPAPGPPLLHFGALAHAGRAPVWQTGGARIIAGVLHTEGPGGNRHGAEPPLQGALSRSDSGYLHAPVVVVDPGVAAGNVPWGDDDGCTQADVAQLAEALRSGRRCCAFESRHRYATRRTDEAKAREVVAELALSSIGSSALSDQAGVGSERSLLVHASVVTVGSTALS